MMLLILLINIGIIEVSSSRSTEDSAWGVRRFGGGARFLP